MATVNPRVKVNGGFIQIQPGTLRIRQNGGWIAPSFVYVRINGVPIDSGYTTYPNSVVSFAISSWSYSSITLTWSAPTGGPPISYYSITKYNASSTPLETKTTTGGTITFDVSPDTNYIFNCYAVSTRGLVSAAAQRRAAIGHPSVTSYRWEQRNQVWYTGGLGTECWHYNGNITGATAPAYNVHPESGIEQGVIVTDFRINIDSPAGFVRTESSYDQACYWMWNGTAGTPTPAYHFNVAIPYAGWPLHPAHGSWSNGLPWGIWTTGAGWNDMGSGIPLRSWIYLHGTYYYAYNASYTSTQALANAEW